METIKTAIEIQTLSGTTEYIQTDVEFISDEKNPINDRIERSLSSLNEKLSQSGYVFPTKEETQLNELKYLNERMNSNITEFEKEIVYKRYNEIMATKNI